MTAEFLGVSKNVLQTKLVALREFLYLENSKYNEELEKYQKLLKDNSNEINVENELLFDNIGACNLAKWVVRNGITEKAVEDLLKVIRTHFHGIVPEKYSTLLKLIKGDINNQIMTSTQFEVSVGRNLTPATHINDLKIIVMLENITSLWEHDK